MSALLASHGFTASPRALEAPRGFVQVVSDKRAWNEITDELGERFEISFNTYKPFACGIVIHPEHRRLRAAARAGRARRSRSSASSCAVHSLVLELTGKKEPNDGLQGKFSVYHGCAAGLMFGRAGEDEFSDDDRQPTRRGGAAPQGAGHRRRLASTRPRADVTAVLTDGRARARASSSTPSARCSSPLTRRAARSQVRRAGRAGARRGEGRRHRCGLPAAGGDERRAGVDGVVQAVRVGEAAVAPDEA